MIEIERSRCAVLPLVLKGKWFDMIARGEKREEYRAVTDYVLTGNRGEQVKQIGNSVPVMTAAAMCGADLLDINKEIKK